MNISHLRQRYQKQRAWGLTASIDLSGCDHLKIQSPRVIRSFVTDLVKSVKMKKYGPTHLKKFGEGELEGYSAMQFIETSSVVVHLDDKGGDRAFIDLFSCKFFDPYQAEQFTKKYFQAKESKLTILLRK